jgi:hypothetical protein
MPDPSMPYRGPSLQRPYGRFRGGSPAGWVACSRHLPFWTPHAVRLWLPRLTTPEIRAQDDGENRFPNLLCVFKAGEWESRLELYQYEYCL